MSLRDEGVIKFSCRKITALLPNVEVPNVLVEFRNQLAADGLIGVYPDGVGFGNISCRTECSAGRFFISGSQTGHLKVIGSKHFPLVCDYSIAENWVSYSGAFDASSESLTHAMIYETFSEADAVIHVHEQTAWSRLRDVVITSRSDVKYGTPEMACEVERLQRETQLGSQKVFVMGGHQDGILSFGDSLRDAYEVLKRALALVT